jgi:hypothetical protein
VQAQDATSSRDFAYRLSEWHREVALDPELKRIMAKSVKPEFEDYSAEEWLEFRFLALSLFRIYETGFIHMSLDLGSREESENHIASAKRALSRLFQHGAGSGRGKSPVAPLRRDLSMPSTPLRTQEIFDFSLMQKIW